MVKKLLVACVLLSTTLAFGQTSTTDLIHGRTYAAEVTHEFIPPRDTNCVDLHTYLSALFGVVGYTPPAGAICYDLDDLVLRCFNGVNWTACGSGTTTDAAAGSVLSSNGSGGLSAVSAIQSIVSGAAVKFPGRYYDWDTNGDGTMDQRLCQDYDGDGSLEWADIQSCIDTLCDRDSDSTQDGTAVDMDGDGTAGTYEKRCGTVYIGPGTWLSSTTATDRINLKWKGLTLLGMGRDSTVLKVGFTRAAYCATLPTVRTAIIQAQDLDGVIVGSGTPGNSKGVDWLELGGMTLIGLGRRSATAAAGTVTGSVYDCNVDGTADAASSGEGLNDIILDGLPGDTNADGSYDTFDNIEYVNVHDMNLLDCDGACMFLNQVNKARIDNMSAKNSSEHCFSMNGDDQAWSRIYGQNCGNENWPGRGFELYAKHTDSKRFSMNDFRFDGYIGIGVISDDARIQSPPGPVKMISGATFSNGYLIANDQKNTGSADTGYCIQSNTASTMAGQIKNVRFENVTMECSSMAINNSQYDQDFTFHRMNVLAADYDNPGQVEVALSGTRTVLSESRIIGADYAGDGTYDSGAGVYVGTCVDCSVSGLRYFGQHYTSATYRSGVAVTELATRFTLRDSEIDIDGTYNTQGIYITGSDAGEYINNTIKLDASINAFGFIWNSDSADNRFINNRVYGGRNGFQAPSPATLTISSVNTGTDIITETTAAGLETGHPLKYTTSGTVITTSGTNGCSASFVSGTTVVYAVPQTTSTIKVASSRANALAGTLCDITGAGTGTQTFSVMETGTAARFNHVETSYVGDSSSYGYNNYYAPEDTDWSWNTCRSPNSANCYRYNEVTYAMGNRVLGAAGRQPSLGSSPMWIDIPGDSNWDGTVDSAMVFSGTSTKQTVCFEGTSNDGGVNCLVGSNPSGGSRTQSIPGSAAQSGNVVLTGDANSGTVVYSDATAGTKDTGNLVCPLIGLTCVTTYTPAGVNAACTNDYNPGAATPFYAVCR